MKKLISAETIRKARAARIMRVEAALPHCIITAEARTLAAQLGVELVVLEPGQPGCTQAPVRCSAASNALEVCSAAQELDDKALKAIRDGVLASYPAGSLPTDLVDQLVRKVVAEQAPPAGTPLFKSFTSSGGIKVIKGDSLRYERFEGAGPGTDVKIVDVVTADDNSSMAAGFMEWKNLFFPWTLTYDEVDMVLEGELHIRHNGETIVGQAGDVMFIPKNSPIEFGTPSHVRFLYVAFPANWQDC